MQNECVECSTAAFTGTTTRGVLKTVVYKNFQNSAKNACEGVSVLIKLHASDLQLYFFL